jgi:hypothetical protein
MVVPFQIIAHFAAYPKSGSDKMSSPEFVCFIFVKFMLRALFLQGLRM